MHTKWTKTPYTWRLDELLRQKYPGRQIELVNGGIGSAGVLDRLGPGGWLHRLRAGADAAAPPQGAKARDVFKCCPHLPSFSRHRPPAAWYQHMKDAKQQGKSWTHVVFLAGINDVWMYKRKAEEAFAVMPSMWKAALDQVRCASAVGSPRPSWCGPSGRAVLDGTWRLRQFRVAQQLKAGTVGRRSGKHPSTARLCRAPACWSSHPCPPT